MLRGDGLVALPGTVRARQPEETWEAVAGHLAEFGITRVADLTGLDCAGLPVWTASRPAARTLSTSQGKGATALLAKLSAVMEAIELWHVEQPLPVAAYGPAAEVAPDCPVTALPLTVCYPERTLAQVVWEWTAGTALVSAEKRLLPVDLVRRRAQRPEWTPDLLRATSTGLACGNTRDEALLHALLEVIERDVLFRDGQVGGHRRTLIAPGTVDDPHGRDVVERLAAAGMALENALVDGPHGLPVCVAYLWSEDYPVGFAGGGCHTSAAIALTRALTEAAQSRLAAIAGTRDDLPSDPGSFENPSFHLAPTTGLAPWPEATSHFTPMGGDFDELAGAVAQRIARVTGHEPVALDLTAPNAPVHAVQVICPGTRSAGGSPAPGAMAAFAAGAAVRGTRAPRRRMRHGLREVARHRAPWRRLPQGSQCAAPGLHDGVCRTVCGARHRRRGHRTGLRTPPVRAYSAEGDSAGAGGHTPQASTPSA